jgi:hypothetical protein
MASQQHNTTVAGYVYETSEWGKFKFNKLNRPVDEGRVEYWKKVLANNNLLRDNPFLIDEDFNIIDGQHRLMAARALELPVYYMVANKAHISDAATINSQNKVWSAADYLQVWCNAGNPNYIKVRAVIELYPFLKIGQAALLMERTSAVAKNDRWKNGQFVVTDNEFVHRVAQCAMDFARFVPFWKDYTFINALSNLCDNTAYDHERMMRKMEMVGNRLKRCATAKDYIEIMSGIYNYKVREDAIIALRLLNARSNERRGKSSTPATYA